MNNKIINIVLCTFIATFLFLSCTDEKFNTSENAQLAFSTDTIMFDTIFTTIGTSTQSFKIYNQHNQALLISSIKLAGGNESPYRLNIDGEMTNEIYDVSIAPHDSLFIFVEVRVDPNGVNQPMIVQDSVVFSTNSNMQDVDLLAWGQDFIPINNEVITTTTWTANKPYLIYNIAYVDSGEVLTIEPGTQIHLHKDARLIAGGNIIAKGSPESPIVFQGDRLEDMYFDIPDQWNQILILPNEKPSTFENVEILNARFGLQVGAIEFDGRANAVLKNVKIAHMGFSGIFAINSNIEASNVLIADCGSYAFVAQAGGSYNFNHCTVANYWGNYSSRKTPSLHISNRLVYDNIEYIGNLEKATWTNSIIWGNASSEVELARNTSVAFNCLFDNCIVKASDSLYKAEPTIFRTSFLDDPKFTSPEPEKYNFELDTLSPAKDIGLIKYGELVPLDLKNVSRLNDKAPDLGAYERIEKKKE